MLLVVPFIGQLLGSLPILIAQLVQGINTMTEMSHIDPMDFESYGINLTVGLVLVIIPFLLSLYLFIKLFKPLHERSFMTVINGTRKIRWGRILVGYAIWGVIMAFILVVDFYLNISNYEVQLNFKALIPLALVSMVLIPFQAFYEEILFRGYLAQGIGRLTTNRLAVILIPSVIFALLHGLNPEVEKHGFWVMMPQYFIVAISYALVSVFDDGIELAMGAHAANNTFISVFVVTEGAVFQTDALLKMLDVDHSKELMTVFFASLVFIGTMAFIYKWSFKTLSAKIVNPEKSTPVV